MLMVNPSYIEQLVVKAPAKACEDLDKRMDDRFVWGSPSYELRDAAQAVFSIDSFNHLPRRSLGDTVRRAAEFESDLKVVSNLGLPIWVWCLLRHQRLQARRSDWGWFYPWGRGIGDSW